MTQHKPRTWEYLAIIGAIIIVIILLYYFVKSPVANQTPSNPLVIPSSNSGNGGVGPVNINFTNLPTTNGIATYIPLFGFVRSGFSM